jgi:hypothetical protein
LVLIVKRHGQINDAVNLIVADKEFTTWKEADAFLAEIKKAGQTDAFLTANYKGKRYYIKDLVEMNIWNNPTNFMAAR